MSTRRVEEGRREERRPAHRVGRRRGMRCTAPRPVGWSSIIPVPTPARPARSGCAPTTCARASRGSATSSASMSRDVPSRAPRRARRSARPPGRAASRSGGRGAAGRPRAREHVAGVVDGAVVDDDELEVVDRLAEDAAHGLLDRRLGVARRRGRRTRAGWPRPAEGSLRRWRKPLQTSASTWSSRRSTAPPTLETLPPLARGADPPALPRSSSSTRTPTTAWRAPRLPRRARGAAPPLGPRPLARAQRGAPRAHGRRRRVSRRRLPLRPGPPRTGRAAVRRRPGARRPHRPRGRRRRLVGPVLGGRAPRCSTRTTCGTA